METEFGILGDAPGLNPMLMSAQIVTAYARHALPQGTAPRWDYSDEDPLNDARGWRLERGAAHPSQLTDRPGGNGGAGIGGVKGFPGEDDGAAPTAGTGAGGGGAAGNVGGREA